MDLYARPAGGDLAAYAGPLGPHMLARANADAPLVAYTPVFWAPYVAAGGPPPGPITAELAVTLDDATLVSVASPRIIGDLAVTIDDASLSAVASLRVVADLAVTLDDASLVSVGSLSITGALSVTLEDARLESNRNWHSERSELVRGLYLSGKADFDMRYGLVYTAELVHVYSVDGVSDIQVGTILYRNQDDTAYVSPTNASRTGRPLALVKEVAQTVANVLTSGNVVAAYTGLGEGAAGLVAVDFSTGRLKRSTAVSAGDELVGWCDTLGNAHLLFGGMGTLPIYRGTGAPTTGTWAVGDTVYHSAPTAGGFIGWVCVAGGTPGTWKTFGAVSS